MDSYEGYEIEKMNNSRDVIKAYAERIKAVADKESAQGKDSKEE